MKKQMYNPTMMIKSKFSNLIHKLLEPNIHIKKSVRWRYKNNHKLTDKEKLEIYEKIVKLHDECSEELTNYQQEKRIKNWVNKARIARGWKPKEKTRKENLVTI